MNTKKRDVRSPDYGKNKIIFNPKFEEIKILPIMQACFRESVPLMKDSSEEAPRMELSLYE